jgi:hypothetical protein
MLKYELETLEGLDAAQHGFYEKNGDSFRLKVEGLEIPDVSGLQKKVDELLGEKKAEAAKRKEAEETARKAAEEAARKSGDVEAVEKSLRDLFGKDIKERDDKLATVSGQLHTLLVRDQAQRVAAELAVDTDALPILAEFVQNRLTMVERDGQYHTAVKGEDGKPSGLTLEEFSKSLTKNKALARLLKASDATGGGAKGSTGGGAANKTVTRTQFDQMSHFERASFAKDGGKVMND